MAKKEFEEVSLPMWKLAFAETAGKIYRVFKSETEFEEIEATSANEAIQKAGFDEVFQIKIGAMDEVTVLEQEHLSEVPQEILDEMPIEAAATQPSPA